MLGKLKEFKLYMTKYDLINSATAFLIALTLRELISNFIQNMVIPILSAIFKVKQLEQLSPNIPFINISLPIGHLIVGILNFIVFSFTIFLIVDFLNDKKIVVKDDSLELKEMRNMTKNLEKNIELQQKNVEILEKVIIQQEKQLDCQNKLLDYLQNIDEDKSKI